MRSAVVPAAAVLGLALASCSRPDPSVLATFDGGQVRRAELEARILELPESQRAPAKGQDAQAWHAGLVRELAFERLLAAEARRAGAETDPEFVGERTALRKRLLAALYIKEHLTETAPPTEPELLAYFEQHPEAFRRRARREVYTIFKRAAPGADRGPRRREMEGLRARVLAGEPFAELAAAHSDSETRHRKGLWGWIHAGSIGPELERVIFALPERTPSAVLSTREGLHLFWVSVSEPEVELEFAQARALAARMLLRERQEAAVRALLDPHREADSFVPTPEQLSTLLASGDGRTLILRVGEARLHLDELMRLVLEAGGGQVRPPFEVAQEVVKERYRRELASRMAVAQGLDRSASFREREAALVERALADFQLRRRLRAAIDGAALQRYFDDNRQRYATPLLVRTEVLSLPLSPAAPRHMAELERARDELDAGRTTLQGLASRLGGTLEDQGWRTLDQLEQIAAGMSHWALELQPGRHSAPFRTARTIVVARVLSRREPEPQALDDARPRVVEDYVRERGQALRADVLDRVLREKGFKAVEVPGRAEASHSP
jgi:parvulin-like peptidyl-prolyl isomerase